MRRPSARNIRISAVVSAVLAIAFLTMIGGCDTAPQPVEPPHENRNASPPARASAPVRDEPAARQQTMAYVDGEAVTLGALHRPMVEAAGGLALSEVVLDRLLERRLRSAGITLDDQRVQAERRLLAESLGADNADEAARLVQEIRRRRGLGEARFTALLWRNAAMRALVEGRVEVTPEAIERAYRLTYGERYHARIVTVPTLTDANRVRGQLLAGEVEFSDAAIEHSTDPSAVQGGLLPAISPVDPAVPQAIRDTLVRMDRDGRLLSDVVALDSGYALLRLERKSVAQSVELADVEDRLAEDVRRSAERVLMQQLARELLASANVVVLDPSLDASWQVQRRVLLGP
jgi:parvulin-like peptidyl-prolyl isomerase